MRHFLNQRDPGHGPIQVSACTLSTTTSSIPVIRVVLGGSQAHFHLSLSPADLYGPVQARFHRYLVHQILPKKSYSQWRVCHSRGEKWQTNRVGISIPTERILCIFLIVMLIPLSVIIFRDEQMVEIHVCRRPWRGAGRRFRFSSCSLSNRLDGPTWRWRHLIPRGGIILGSIPRDRLCCCWSCR